MKKMNSSQREIVEENNGILKTTASESYSKEVNDIEREDQSVWEHKEATITEIISVNPLDKMHSSREECKESKRKSTEKTDVATIGKRVHQRPFCDIIGKREQRREELEKMEGDMRKRLDMLECSMPAVMVWNILKKSQGAPACNMGRILEKQFKRTKDFSCRSTPSCHYDCRVRKVEAERKLALKKMEEARTLWSEKLTMLEKRKRKLEEARKIQEEQRNAMEQLNEEAKALREAMEKRTKMDEMDESCQYGECGDIQCKQRWLDKVSSVTSIESEDIQCLDKLQQLAEEEVIIKRGIVELERREEAYMRTLQQADELWSKMEGDTVSTTSALREQLDMKTAANQQLADRVCELEDALEKCRAKMAACRAELEKFLSIEKIETTIGRDDDVAEVTDKAVTVKAKVVHRPIGRVDDVAMVKDSEVLARVEVADEEALAKVEAMDEKALARSEVADEETLARVALIDADAEVALVGDDKYVSVKPDLADLAVERPTDLVRIEDAETIVQPEDYEQERFKEVREYLTKLGSLEELYKDGEPCPPDFVCNDVVFSPTGMTDEELIALGVDLSKKPDEKLIAYEEKREKPFREELMTKEMYDVVERKEKKADEMSVEIEGKLVIKVKEQIVEAIDVPLKEIRMRRAILEEVVDDKPVTMPDVRVSEIKKIETDQAIVVQRDTVLSWINMIDTIRTSAAKHPDCYTVKEDADVLVEQLGAYVGIKPNKAKEEDAIINTEDKREKVIEKNEIKVKEQIITETKLQDELIVSKDIIMEPLTEEVPSPRPEEISIEVNAPMEPVADLLPTLTKEEISVGMEPPTAVSIENSFQPPTIPVKEDLKSVAVPTTEPVSHKIEIEKTEIEEETQVKEIVHDAKEAEISQVNKVKEKAAFEDLLDKKLATETTINDKKEVPIKEAVIEKEEDAEKERENKKLTNETIINDKKEVPIKEAVTENEEDAEKEKVNEKLPVLEEDAEKEREDKKLTIEPIINDKKEVSIKEAVTENEEDAEKEKIDEKLPVLEEDAEKERVDKKLEEIDEKRVEDVEELEKIQQIDKIKMADTEEIPRDAEIIETKIPEVDLIEVEKIEPSELPIVDVKEVPISVKEKITVEEPPSAKEELLISDAITKEKVEIEEPTITDIIQKEIEIEEIPVITDVIKEPIPAEIITEEKIEIPPERVIPKEIEEIEKIEQFIPEAENKKEDEEIKEIPEKVTPVKLFEEREKIPLIEKEEIVTKIPPIMEEKKPKLVEEKLKIPITEVKPAEIEVPIIPIDSRLLPPPYFIIAKIKEKELLQIAPMMKLPCAECCLQPPPPPVETTKQVGIMQINVAQTEIAQTKVAQTEIVETEIVEITTQTVSIADQQSSRMSSLSSEYLKPAGLKVSSAKIASDRPEITDRKMPWHKRLKDQSTVTTVNFGSQTDKSRVSHDRVARDERERARMTTDELLRAIKIAAELARPDAEREIRTINYGGKADEIGRTECNCCQCGRTSTPPSTGPRLKVRPQIDAKTAATLPPAVAAFKRTFIPPKIDRPILYDRLCPDCKAKIQGRMSHEKYRVEKITSRDQGSCGCASSIDKSCRVAPRKREIEKKDQASLARIAKRRTNLSEQKKKDDLQSIVEKAEKFDVEPLSPSCICYKLPKISVEPVRKGNCYCGD